jgi:hypothetical protein
MSAVANVPPAKILCSIQGGNRRVEASEYLQTCLLQLKCQYDYTGEDLLSALSFGQ